MFGAIYFGEGGFSVTFSYVPFVYNPVNISVKSLDSWSNNITKTLETWTLTQKNPSLFSPELVSGVPYLYDDPTITYDNDTHFYDLTVNGNQTNSKISTNWSLYGN